MTEQRTAVYVRYRDHVLFKDVDPSALKPLEREAIGFLAHEATDYIQIIWERSVENGSNPAIKTKATGLVILRSDILELKPLNESNIYKAKQGIIDFHEKNRDHDKNFQAHDRPLERAGKEGRYLRSDNKPAYRRGEKA